jgi:hypothetical protein
MSPGMPNGTGVQPGTDFAGGRGGWTFMRLRPARVDRPRALTVSQGTCGKSMALPKVSLAHGFPV